MRLLVGSVSVVLLACAPTPAAPDAATAGCAALFGVPNARTGLDATQCQRALPRLRPELSTTCGPARCCVQWVICKLEQIRADEGAPLDALYSFLAAEGLVSYAKANRLIAIVRKVPREQALVLGQERAFALVAYTEATPEGDSPAALLAADAKLGATPVAQASVRQIEAATRAARSARAKSGAASEGARARARADADTLRAVKKALRDAGLAGAAVQVGRSRVTITVDRARADRLARS